MAKLIDGIDDFCKSLGLDSLANFDPDAAMSAKMHKYNELRKQYLGLFMVRHVVMNLLCDILNIFKIFQKMSQEALRMMQNNSTAAMLEDILKLCTLFNSVSNKCERLANNIRATVPEARD